MERQKTDQKTIRAVIVDDEQHAVDELEELLEARGGLHIVGKYADPEEAISGILALRPNLLFLDIQMPDMSGFDILNKLSREGFEPAVIFITAYREYAIEAIKHAAFDYILKPVEKQELYQALFRFFLTYAHADMATNYRKLFDAAYAEPTIKLPVESGFRVFKLADIVYIACDYHWTRVWTGKDQSQLVTANLSYIEERLPAEQFVRISEDVIIHVNYLKKVRKLSRQCVLGKNGELITLALPLAYLRVLDKYL